MTLRSAAKGVIDYSEADFHSPSWWRRWRYLLKTMAEVEHGELLRAAYDFQLALVSNSKLSPENFQKVQQDAKDQFADLESLLKPWMGKTKEDRQAKEARQFAEMWEEVAGFSVKDEEAMQAWEDKVQEVTKQALVGKQEADEEERKRTASFEEVARKVKEKRLRQQGRLL